MYDRAHYLFTFGGTAISGLEQWQTGLRFAPDAGTSESELLAQLSAISVSDCFDAMAAVISNASVPLDYLNTVVAKFAKVAVIKPDGTYAGAPKLHEGTVPGKSTATLTTPPQSAWVVTLGTGKSFGMAQKGRMYWPVPHGVSAAVSTATGQVLQTSSDGFRSKVGAAIAAVEGEITTVNVSVSAAVMSKSGGVHAPQAPGTTNYVTEISVGRVLDTQRRRRGALNEAYMPAPALAGLRDGQLRQYGRSDPS